MSNKILHVIFLFFIVIHVNAQENQDSSKLTRLNAPNLFFDCEFCNIPYYTQNLPYINFVRDRRLSDIYLMITVNSTGSKGSLFKLFFIGEKRFEHQNDTLSFEAPANMSEADIRDGILNQLKIGLLKYLAQTELAKNIQYTIEIPEENLSPEKAKDKWNLWTFTINTDLNGNGNAYSKGLNMNYFANANRTTDKFKTETGGWSNTNNQEFKVNDSTTIKGNQSNSGMYHITSFSVGKHFALGHFFSLYKSSQNNIKNSLSYLPAIEYNLFPYSEASRRQLRFIYRIGLRFQDYNELTILNKMNETFQLHSLVLQYLQIEKWGNINISAGGNHYFNYSKNYSLSIFPSINFNPLKGLRINLWSGFQILNDQFFLRASEVSAEEILLNQVNLQTNFSYSFGAGIGYTFGSRYNNVVNVRFDLNDNYW